VRYLNYEDTPSIGRLCLDLVAIVAVLDCVEYIVAEGKKANLLHLPNVPKIDSSRRFRPDRPVNPRLRGGCIFDNTKTSAANKQSPTQLAGSQPPNDVEYSPPALGR